MILRPAKHRLLLRGRLHRPHLLANDLQLAIYDKLSPISTHQQPTATITPPTVLSRGQTRVKRASFCPDSETSASPKIDD